MCSAPSHPRIGRTGRRRHFADPAAAPPNWLHRRCPASPTPPPHSDPAGCQAMQPPTLTARKPSPHHRGAALGLQLDRLLATLCLLASATLLYRCLVFTGGLPFGGGGSGGASTTVISATTTAPGAGNVVTQLVIDRLGRTRSTTVTHSDQGMSITVLGSDASLRSRRAALRQAVAQRRAAYATLEAPGEQQQEPEAYPGLPHDFDPQARLPWPSMVPTRPVHAAGCVPRMCGRNS